MAFNIVDQSYSGKYSPYFIMPALYGMDTVSSNVAHIVGDIGKQYTIGRINAKNPLRKRKAVPVATDNNPFKIDGKLLLPKDAMCFETFNPRDLETNQLADALSTTLLSRQVPQELQSQMIQLILNRAAEGYEDLLWMGSEGFATDDEEDPKYVLQFMDGWMRRFILDPLVNLSSISPVAITISNISTIMDDLIIQATIKKKALVTDKQRFQRLKFLMSPGTGSIYQQYLRTGASFKGNSFEVGYIPPWGGYRVETLAGMPDNTILFLRATDENKVTNLYIGMNSMEDWQLQIGKTKESDETYFIKGLWKWDVNYGWGEEIFMYTILTAADFVL